MVLVELRRRLLGVAVDGGDGSSEPRGMWGGLAPFGFACLSPQIWLGGRVLLCVVWKDLVDEVYRGDEHPPAAVSLYLQPVEDLSRVFACLHLAFKVGEPVADHLDAGKAPNR